MPISSRITAANLSLILDAIPLPVFIKDNSSRIVGMNKACEEQWGVDFHNIEMTLADSIFPEDQIERFLEKDREIFRDGVAVNFEEPYWNNKLQQNRFARTFKSPIYDSEGRPEFLVCVLIDITDQKSATDSLRLSEEKLRSLYEMAPLGIALTDMSGKYIEFNEAFSRICGYTKAELAKLDYWALTPPEYEEDEGKQLELMAKTGRYGPYEKEYIHSSGARIPLRLNGILVTGIDGKKYIWSIVEDISEQKKAEMRIRQSQKLEAIGQLTAGIAHDFNNLLAVIAGNLELVKKETSLSEFSKQRLAGATSAATRAASLTQHLLSFGRKQNLSPSLTDLCAEAREIASMLRRLIPVSISIKIETDASPVVARVDKNQFGNALINLALNARDAMKQGGTLRISVHSGTHADAPRDNTGDSESEYAVISIQDTGEGMGPETMSKAFDPYFTTKETGEGSGLGLSMVYGFMRQSNGHIHLTSAVGEGTTVTLLFPLAGEQDVTNAVEHAHHKDPSATRAYKVLLVEDMNDVRDVISVQLATLGHTVTAVDTGAAALAVLETSSAFDFLMTDMGLPGGMSGIALAKAVCARYPSIRILIMSGYNSPEAPLNEDPRFSKWLHKPFDLAQLNKAISEIF